MKIPKVVKETSSMSSSTSVEVKAIAVAADLPAIGYPESPGDPVRPADKSVEKSCPSGDPAAVPGTDNKPGFDTPTKFTELAVNMPFKLIKFLDKGDPRWDLNPSEEEELKKYAQPVLDKYLPEVIKKYPGEIALAMCLGSVILSKASKPRQLQLQKKEVAESKTFTKDDNAKAAVEQKPAVEKLKGVALEDGTVFPGAN